MYHLGNTHTQILDWLTCYVNDAIRKPNNNNKMMKYTVTVHDSTLGYCWFDPLSTTCQRVDPVYVIWVFPNNTNQLYIWAYLNKSNFSDWFPTKGKKNTVFSRLNRILRRKFFRHVVCVWKLYQNILADLVAVLGEVNGCTRARAHFHSVGILTWRFRKKGEYPFLHWNSPSNCRILQFLVKELYNLKEGKFLAGS